MQKLPKAVTRLIDKFERLPGVGPKSAQRLVFYLLHNPEHELVDFAEKLLALKKNTVMCEKCHNIAESTPCPVCSDSSRDKSLLCIVEQPLDLLALEKSDVFHGHYHVLHGSISPLNNIGPEQLYLRDITKRLDGVKEIILATNPTMEGEATALYITEVIRKNTDEKINKIAITRIGHGLPIGADIEYADGVTLARALEGRRQVGT
ncbi:MAG: recombination protein RecR [Candidatus Pacebacteria bacterium CG10_big_fil_rev_8_21_14_0_10_36_11]|nr:recombination protein RecR [Candidatus Pacearchaeota archaeon]OIP74024.1 MAG: recombination protein RecR [Candidatus Pacebacteria bacterium CG2_30_36_39]PIR64335.1 MAG: recombination protein RecR [Candidatus Pacebacteria bacterium CG10_big_fil_rev_8_21_14_0_10_36_11]